MFNSKLLVYQRVDVQFFPPQTPQSHPRRAGQAADAQNIGPLGPWTHAAIRRCQGLWVAWLIFQAYVRVSPENMARNMVYSTSILGS